MDRKSASKGVSLHSLRHAHASTLLSPACPIANVSKRLGHRDAYTTAKIYQHPLPDTDQDVAATWDKLMAEKRQPKPVADSQNVRSGRACFSRRLWFFDEEPSRSLADGTELGFIERTGVNAAAIAVFALDGFERDFADSRLSGNPVYKAHC